MALLYADENFPFPVVTAVLFTSRSVLRRLGHDVLTTQEAGKAEQSVPDEEILAFASAQGRAVLTLNLKHFIHLHRAQPAVLSTSRSVHEGFEIGYRSFGLMQILDMGHPGEDYTRGEEVGNITNRELRVSVEKNISAGAHLLRSLLTGSECIYDEDDERYHECVECIGEFETVERDWTETRFHKWRSSEVPSHDKIPCGWSEAIRRYNGSGADAEAYRDEILTRITGADRTYLT